MVKALILVDIQNDFLPGGALAVPQGDQVVGFANSMMPNYELIVATQDWHPADHLSFASQHGNHEVGEVIELDGLSQVLWPDHCIQDSTGAEFAKALNRNLIHHVVPKGTNRTIDSYSGFFDNARRQATGLETFLKDRDVQEVDVMGLATDYCVKFTALDAHDLGFKTNLLLDGIRGVDLTKGDCDRAISEMKSAGVRILA